MNTKTFSTWFAELLNCFPVIGGQKIVKKNSREILHTQKCIDCNLNNSDKETRRLSIKKIFSISWKQRSLHSSNGRFFYSVIKNSNNDIIIYQQLNQKAKLYHKLVILNSNDQQLWATQSLTDFDGEQRSMKPLQFNGQYQG